MFILSRGVGGGGGGGDRKEFLVYYLLIIIMEDKENNNFRYNSLYSYTFISILINNDNDFLNIRYDKSLLLNYIFYESCPQRINHFEILLWRPEQDDNYYDADAVMSTKLINYYFCNKDDDDDAKEIKNYVKQDLSDLRKKYHNYDLNLLDINYDDYIMMMMTKHRKFLLNLSIFMNDDDDDNNKLLLMKNEKRFIITIVKLWYEINIDIDTLRETFIPKAFANWFKNYIFHLDYFCTIASDKAKEEIYDTFLYSIINNSDKIEKEVENVLVLKRYTHKPVYELSFAS